MNQYSFSASGLTLSAGNYKRYTLTWTGAPSASEAEYRAPKVGDYVYADGSIYPVEMAENLDDKETIPNYEDCVGIVFSTTTSTKDQSNGWSNGYVVALSNVNKNYGTDSDAAYETKWASNYGSTINSATFNWSDDLKMTSGNEYTDMDGYTYTTKWAELSDGKYYDAFYNATNKTGITLFSASSDWYLPSPGQLKAIVDNLSGTNAITANFGSSNKSAAINTYIANIETMFAKAGGVFEADDIRSGASNIWWSSNWEYNSDDTPSPRPIGLLFTTGSEKGEFTLLLRSYNNNGAAVRPVFAF